MPARPPWLVFVRAWLAHATATFSARKPQRSPTAVINTSSDRRRFSWCHVIAPSPLDAEQSLLSAVTTGNPKALLHPRRK